MSGVGERDAQADGRAAKGASMLAATKESRKH